MTSPAALGLACAAVTCVAWGVADFLAARITRRVGEFSALFRIQLVGAPVLLLAWTLVDPSRPAVADMAWISAAAACFLVGYFSFFYGLRVGAISLVSPISSAGAVVPVLAGIALFGELASGPRLGGVGLALLGIVVLTADPAAIGSLAPSGRREGIIAGLITLLAWGSGTALLLPAIRHAGAFVPVAVLRLEVLAVLAAWWLIRWSVAPGTPAVVDAPSRDDSADVGWRVIVPAAVLDLTAFFAYGIALQNAPAAVAAPIASAYPLVTILIARQRLDERLSGREWLGVALTLAGAALLGTDCCAALDGAPQGPIG